MQRTYPMQRRRTHPALRCGLLAVLFAGTLLQTAQAQDCKMLFCGPSFQFLPSVAVTNLFDPATVRLLPDGPEKELESEAHPAVALNVGIPSTIPRTSFFFQAIWLPFAGDDQNTFTGYTASDLEDADEISANLPVLEFGASFTILKRPTTSGWLGLKLNVMDQFGPAGEPEDAREYTHKLNLELDASFGIFNWVSRGNWFRNVTAYAALNYLVTGLPDEGDEIPKGVRVFQGDASPWSFWTGLVIPIAPIAPQP